MSKMSSNKRSLASTNTTGYTGVTKKGKKFQAQIRIDHKMKYLGTFDTPKEAALAYDRAVIQHKLLFSQLNFPDGLPLDKGDYDEIMNPTKKRRLDSTNTNGFNGVYKAGLWFEAKIHLGGSQKYLGRFDTAYDAAIGYDRAVIQYNLPSSKLNFPIDYDDTPSSEDDERYDEESDDDEEVVEPHPYTQARTYFERTPRLVHIVKEDEYPMLDQLVREGELNKNDEYHKMNRWKT